MVCHGIVVGMRRGEGWRGTLLPWNIMGPADHGVEGCQAVVAGGQVLKPYSKPQPSHTVRGRPHIIALRCQWPGTACG
eukprot:scaffold191425_cov22-Prasinocladus_malaysianus.AAC.1